MTNGELKAHCQRQIESCEMWAKHKGEEPHGKIYEEHKLILELLEQEPRKGHWMGRWYAGHNLHFHVCSECNEEFSCDMETGISIDNYRYCPNCGADMREVEE